MIVMARQEENEISRDEKQKEHLRGKGTND